MANKSPTFDADRHCGARTRSGKPCRNPQGFRVPGREGVGRCYLHGGPAHAASRKHGLYATLRSPRVRELLERVEESGQDMLDLEPEARLCRALTVDYLERYAEISEALTAWKATTDAKLEAMREALRDGDLGEAERVLTELHEARCQPPRSLDVQAVGQLVERIGRTVERMHKIRMETSVTGEQLKFIFEAQARILRKYLGEATLRRVLKDYEQISWI